MKQMFFLEFACFFYDPMDVCNLISSSSAFSQSSLCIWKFSVHILLKPAAATAKSLQLCPTVCDPTDGSPPGSSVPEILQARTLEWVAIAFSEKNTYICLIYYAKDFDCVHHRKLWKILQEMGISDHLTCLLRNLYADEEAAARTGHGTTDWF